MVGRDGRRRQYMDSIYATRHAARHRHPAKKGHMDDASALDGEQHINNDVHHGIDAHQRAVAGIGAGHRIPSGTVSSKRIRTTDIDTTKLVRAPADAAVAVC